MTNNNFGKLRKVKLREAWGNEASDFTNWLAEEENLVLLSDEIGIDIKLIQKEAGVGSFNVDILAEEENSSRRVVIENQLEITDHDHLGKIITYASGQDAEIIIWIVKDVREEHRQAVDWLNEHTDEKVNIFIIKMELWKIDNSASAPKFQVISQPNDWAKAIKQSTKEVGLTATQILQLDFWNKFKEYAQSQTTSLRLRRTNPQHWYNVSIGVSEAYICLTINIRVNSLGCELYIPEASDVFLELGKRKEKIEKEIGASLEWMELPSKKASRIKISREGDINETQNWDDHFKWLVVNAGRFYKVFPKHIKEAQEKLNLSEGGVEEIKSNLMSLEDIAKVSFEEKDGINPV